MNNKFSVEQLVKLTIDKAKKEGKHPFEILEEVKRLIEQKRTMERQMITLLVSIIKNTVNQLHEKKINLNDAKYCIRMNSLLHLHCHYPKDI